MLHEHASKNLFFRSLLYTLLEFTLPIGSHSRLPIFSGRRRHECITLESFADTDALQDRRLHYRIKSHAVIREDKVESTKPVASALVWGRLDNAVDGGFVITPREKFQTVAGIDDLRNGELAIVRGERDIPAHSQCV
jgi:hypothetical protein